jgi:hypothetical protein
MLVSFAPAPSLSEQIEENAYSILALLVNSGARTFEEVVQAIRSRVPEKSESSIRPVLLHRSTGL